LNCSNNQIDSARTAAIYITNSRASFPHNTISGNQITNLIGIGIHAEGTSQTADPHSDISGNEIAGNGSAGVGIVIALQTGASVTNNTISGTESGVFSDSNNPVTVNGNTIHDIRSNGIFSNNDAFGTFDNNSLMNCGLTPGFQPGANAIVYAHSTFGHFEFTNNTYSAKSTKNLTYFIFAHVNPPLTVSGNTTNTMLRNFP
jgi:hypothetical protein